MLILAGLVAGLAAPAWAADRQTSRKVSEANQALAAGRTDDALKLYEEAARSAADAPELAYNRGVALYRKGDRTAAAEQFRKALTTRDIGLEAKAKFNLGNCAYADALEKQEDLKAALEKLRLAISYYKDAIAADPNDLDAKVNIETAQLLMKHLLDQEKNRQEEEKKNPQSQPESQPASQPEQSPQSQPASQPESDPQKQDQQGEQQQDQQQKGEQSKDERQQGEQKQGEQKEGEQKEGEQKEGQQDDKQGSDDKGKVEAQQQEAKGQQDKPGDSGEQVQVLELTPEQAEALLQKIRDRERQRREALLRLQRSRQVPVEKDW